MDFSQFKHKFQNQSIIVSRDVLLLAENPQILSNQLCRWHKKGLLISLRKGLYVLNAQDRRVDINSAVIANILYEPSYLSLEYALNYYSLIPEKVADFTSVSTRKTMRFKNEIGSFIYQHIKPQAFRGFKRIGNGKDAFFMAEPEKAVVDFLYLNLSRIQNNTREILEESYRFQNIEDLSAPRLLELGKLFQNKKLMRVIKQFIAWIAEVRS